MSVGIEVFGLDALMRRMEGLEAEVQKKSIRQAMRTMGKVYTREIKKRAADLDIAADARKVLMRAVFMQVTARGGQVRLAVRIRKPDRRSDKPGDAEGQNAARQDAYYWRWLEYGTAKRYRAVQAHYDIESKEVSRREVWDKRGEKFRKATAYRQSYVVKVRDRQAYTGFIRPQPFVRPAIWAAREWALRAFEAELRHLIDEAWKRNA